ncbi:hypothetical protein [Mycolicibacterium novocastrense]|uniref:hypothetical protein n=1 Tax=Mycolicibacterium novocastrense TaxID=59813 RepID=UPI0013F4C3ED|nr:hypothetical protein [Mycolicibacterium novocastrense]
MAIVEWPNRVERLPSASQSVSARTMRVAASPRSCHTLRGSSSPANLTTRARVPRSTRPGLGRPQVISARSKRPSGPMRPSRVMTDGGSVFKTMATGSPMWASPKP